MSQKSKIFDCSIIFLPDHIACDDESIHAANKKEIPFNIGRIYHIRSHDQQHLENAINEGLDCFIMAASGSCEVSLDDGVNKKTVQLNGGNLGVYVRAGIRKKIFNFSDDAHCLVLVSETLPLVSVVTCSYNNSRFIIETLDSIKKQTYPNIELIIVDDCSTDDSVAVIDEWLKTYTRPYKFIKHPVNEGGSKPYNVGIRSASGKYYSPIDSDDTMMPEKIERQVMLLETAGPDVAAVYSDTYVMDVDSDPIDGLFIQRHRKFTEMPSGNIYDTLLQGNYIPLLSVLIRKRVLDEIGYFDETLIYGDYDLWLRIARKYHFIYSDYASATYRIRPGSLSHTTTRDRWNFSDAKIFSKHAGAKLPMDRVQHISREAYYYNEHDTMPFINQLAENTKNLFLKSAWLFWKLQIPFDDGNAILSEVNNDQFAMPAEQEGNEADLKIFARDIMPKVPAGLLKKIVWQSYMQNNEAVLPLVGYLADNTSSKYVKMTGFLWKYNFPAKEGADILAAMDDDTGNIEVQEQVADVKAEFIMKQVVPAVPAPFLRDVFFKAYCDNDPLFLNNTLVVAEKTNSRFLMVMFMLCRFNIPVELGKSILGHVNRNMPATLPLTLKTTLDIYIRVFIYDILAILPVDLQKQVVLAVCQAGMDEFMLHAKDLWKKTNNRYLKAAWLLWKNKVPARKAVAVLDVTDSYYRANFSPRYIDFCIYRNIFAAKNFPGSFSRKTKQAVE
jgi:glycosyltransferase involved in cell wall biosynthesis